MAYHKHFKANMSNTMLKSVQENACLMSPS
jgi:hypothetical protein